MSREFLSQLDHILSELSSLIGYAESKFDNAPMASLGGGYRGRGHAEDDREFTERKTNVRQEIKSVLEEYLGKPENLTFEAKTRNPITERWSGKLPVHNGSAKCPCWWIARDELSESLQYLLDLRNRLEPTRLKIYQPTIFYSWQSWVELNRNANLIEEAIRAALADIKTITGSFEKSPDRDELELDYATKGTSGSVDIADTILRKIDECNIFICDVTSVATFTTRKGIVNLLPNPNVLFELGYAGARLPWDRVICVNNNAEGRIENLPFDIRKRKIVNYTLTSEESNDRSARNNALGHLKREILAQIKVILQIS